MEKIAFIGLGNMGGPMAVNLLKSGHDVVGLDVDQAARKKFAESGGGTAELVAEAVKGAGVVVTMLPAGRHVESVYQGENGILANCDKNTVLIDSSTIDVETARVVGKSAEDAGLSMIDAPVSGGVGGAEAGTLTFMVGGPDSAFEKAKPYLEIMGKTIVHAGGSGNGQAAKICNNMILGVSMIGVSEAFLLAEKLGLDHQKLFDISSKSSGQCWSLTTYCPVPGPVPTSPANRSYKAGFSAEMMRKDLRLAQGAVSGSGSVTPLGAEAAAIYDLYCAHGNEGVDFSGIINFLRGQASQ